MSISSMVAVCKPNFVLMKLGRFSTGQTAICFGTLSSQHILDLHRRVDRISVGLQQTGKTWDAVRSVPYECPNLPS
jgi:hypothetical protein